MKPAELLDREEETHAISPWVDDLVGYGVQESGGQNLMGDGIWTQENDGVLYYNIMLLNPFLSRHACWSWVGRYWDEQVSILFAQFLWKMFSSFVPYTISSVVHQGIISPLRGPHVPLLLLVSSLVGHEGGVLEHGEIQRQHDLPEIGGSSEDFNPAIPISAIPSIGFVNSCSELSGSDGGTRWYSDSEGDDGGADVFDPPPLRRRGRSKKNKWKSVRAGWATRKPRGRNLITESRDNCQDFISPSAGSSVANFSQAPPDNVWSSS